MTEPPNSQMTVWVKWHKPWAPLDRFNVGDEKSLLFHGWHQLEFFWGKTPWKCHSQWNSCFHFAALCPCGWVVETQIKQCRKQRELTGFWWIASKKGHVGTCYNSPCGCLSVGRNNRWYRAKSTESQNIQAEGTHQDCQVRLLAPHWATQSSNCISDSVAWYLQKVADYLMQLFTCCFCACFWSAFSLWNALLKYCCTGKLMLGYKNLLW